MASSRLSLHDTPREGFSSYSEPTPDRVVAGYGV